MSPTSPDPTGCRLLTVILVDDEPSFRHSLAGALGDDGHDVLEYSSAAGIPPFDTLPRDAILLTDLEVPGANGIEIAEAFRRVNPRGRAILLSPYAIPTIGGAVVTRPWLRFVSKPVDYEILHRLIHALAG